MVDTLAVNRIAWWRFNNNLLDSSGNNKTLIGIPTYGIDKDGINNSCIVGNNILGLDEMLFLKEDNQPFAFYIFFEKNTETSQQVLIGNGQGGSTNGFFLDKINGTWVVRCNGGEQIPLNFTENEWNSFVVSYDGTTLKVRANGIEILNIAKSLHTVSGIQPAPPYNRFAVGGYSNRVSYPYLSKYDEVGVYSRSLTDSEMILINTLGVNYQPDITPPSLNASYINEVTGNSSKLNVTSNEDSTAYYEIRESPTNNAKVGYVLTEPESGWTRYKVSDGVSLNNRIVLGDSGFMGGSYESPSDGCLYHVSTTDFSKIPLGSKIRVIGKDIKTLEPYTENVFVAEFIVDQETINAGYISVAAPGQEISVKALSAIDIVLPPPTPTELKVTHTGTIALTATVESQVEITGLTADREYDCYIVAEDTEGNLQTTVTKLEFKLEEEEEMKEIMLGLIFLKLRVVGTTEWTEIGDSKTEAKFKFEEKFADVKTVESGNVDKVLESTTASLEVGISQLSKALIDKLSASINSVTEGTAPNEVTYLEGGAGIGSVATKYEVIAHPIEEGTGTEYDIYLPKATIETSIDKTGKAGDQLVFNLKIEGLYDRDKKCKFRIGKNPA